MSNFLKDLETVDGLIRDVEKINSKMQSGHFIHAYRDIGRVHAQLMKIRKEFIASQEIKNEE